MSNSISLNGVSVVIPTIDRAEVLIDTLKDIINQDFVNYEIIVIDQSDEINFKAIEFLDSSKITCRYFNAHFKGLPQARNFGLKQASKDIILYIDDDIRCEKDLIRNHYQAHLSHEADLVAGGITEKGDIANDKVAGYFNKWTATAVSNFSSTVSGRCSHGKGCNFSIKKRALFKVGGVDELLNIGAALYEESELALRLEKAGYKAWFEPKAHLIHLAAPMGGCRVIKDWPKYMYGLGHNRAILVFRHLSPIYWPTALIRTLLLGISYSRLDKSIKPFISVVKGLNHGRKAARLRPLNTDLSGEEILMKEAQIIRSQSCDTV
ncbi:glycosyltransferase family 2 protein [Psychrobacter arenosus]|uniref:glycosyltransferase family 2 protein n=1 Tax=Psychrobacter arenosus TaxID=256326 RepID=UPI001919EAFA|nr:glycosyltransferase [Psychrobacter arenosus]